MPLIIHSKIYLSPQFDIVSEAHNRQHGCNIAPQVPISYILTTEQSVSTTSCHRDYGKIRYLPEKSNMRCRNIQEQYLPPVLASQDKLSVAHAELYAVSFSQPITTKKGRHLIRPNTNQH